jgi:hypothetical protein
MVELSKGFSSFIVQKGEFIDLLEKNKIIYLMQESLCSSFTCCQNSYSDHYLNGNIPPELAVDYIASGLTAIAKYYVKNRTRLSCEQLEDIVYTMFSGKYLLADDLVEN